ncbi:MAG: hypothetical protein ACSHX7_07630 [Luteolibacter sp.]
MRLLGVELAYLADRFSVREVPWPWITLAKGKGAGHHTDLPLPASTSLLFSVHKSR